MDTEKALQLICENEELRFLIEQEEAWIREQQVLEEPLPEDAEPFVIPQVVDANVTKMMQAEARANFMAFARSHPEFYSSAENTRRAVETFKAYHRVDPPARAKIAADYVRSRGFSQDTTGVQAALRELNDEDLKQQILREE